MVTMKYPTGLGAAGRGLWRQVMTGFELDPAEMATLEQACRTVDLLGRIDVELSADVTAEGSMGQVRAHPLLRSRTELCTLLDAQLRSLCLPVGDESEGRYRPLSARATAVRRWGRNGAA
jgi:hypothetical protein